MNNTAKYSTLHTRLALPVVGTVKDDFSETCELGSRAGVLFTQLLALPARVRKLLFQLRASGLLARQCGFRGEQSVLQLTAASCKFSWICGKHAWACGEAGRSWQTKIIAIFTSSKSYILNQYTCTITIHPKKNCRIDFPTSSEPGNIFAIFLCWFVSLDILFFSREKEKVVSRKQDDLFSATNSLPIFYQLFFPQNKKFPQVKNYCFYCVLQSIRHCWKLRTIYRWVQ